MCVIVRSPAVTAVTVDSLGKHFNTDLQYALSVSFYDDIIGSELWPEFSARGKYSYFL